MRTFHSLPGRGALLGAALLTLTAGPGRPLVAAPGDAQVTPGEFVIEHPTLINLGFEWHIDGDANRNARVEVSFRKQGETGLAAGHAAGAAARRTGLPAQRRSTWSSPNMFAGSILDLEPGTRVRGALRADRSRRRRRTGRRRDQDRHRADAAGAGARPQGGKVYHVYPTKWQGPKIEPAFEGHHVRLQLLLRRRRYRARRASTREAGRHHPGPCRAPTRITTSSTPTRRTINATTTFEGTYYLTADGTPERPIVIKAAGDGEVILDGRGNFNLFNVKAADYNYFEGITFRNTRHRDLGGHAVHRRLEGADGQALPLRGRRHGRVLQLLGIERLLHRRQRVPRQERSASSDRLERRRSGSSSRTSTGQEFPPVMKSYTAIRLYGPGHVVAHNYVADFHDGIDTEMYGKPDGSHPIDGPSYPPREFWDRRPTAIDIYNNYITNAHDNSIEMDGSMHNIRVMRNMLINSASHPMSTQPSTGGPVYFIRNIAYHAPGGSTRLTAGSPGVFFYNNTILDRDQRRGVGERALAQQPDARAERAARDLQRQHQHQLQLVGLQRVPPQSGRHRVVPVELAALRAWRRYSPMAAAPREARAAQVRRRSRPMRRRRSRISTACSSTTTSS